MKKIVVVLALALMVCLSLVWIARIGSDTALTIKNKGYVTVKGFAKKPITADRALFKAALKAQDPDLSLAYAKLAGSKEVVQNFLKRYSIAASEIVFEPVSIYEKYRINAKGYATDELIRYELTQQIQIESKDVEKVAKISSEISEVLSLGVQIVIYHPEYTYTKLDELKVQMIGSATANASERAETIADKAKFKLGDIASVRVGVFQITPAHSTEVDNYGINDMTSIHKEIKSVVSVKYFVR